MKKKNSSQWLQKIDFHISRFAHGFDMTEKFVRLNIVHKILYSTHISSMYTKMKPQLPLIFKLFGSLLLLIGVVGIFASFDFGALGGFLGSSYLAFYAFFIFLLSVFSLLVGIGLIWKKKWTPSLFLLYLGIHVVFLLSSFHGGSHLWSFVVGVFLLFFVLRSKSLFCH